MRRLLLMLCLLFLAGFLCVAQNTVFARPDFDSIKLSIQQKSSAYYYPVLFERYKNNDTTLSETEYRYLYYGYSFQETYSPYGKPEENEKLEKLFKKDQLNEAEKDEIIKLENKVLEKFPFNLRNLNTLITMLENKGDSAAAALQIKKLVGIAKAIFSTGDGKSDTTAMYVISVEHEYDLAGLLRMGNTGAQSLLYTQYGPVDKLELKEKQDNFDAIYFNVTRLFDNMKQLLKNE